MYEQRARRVLITGASRGIGRGIALELHRRGDCVICVARDRVALEHLKKQCEEVRCEILSLDLTQPQSHKALNDYIIESGIDVVVHNVGGRVLSDVQPLGLEGLLESVAFNMGIAVSINEVLLPLFQKQGKGSICHISSMAALTGNTAPGYAAAKAGLNAYIKSCARFFAKDNICIFGIMPGIIDTDVWLRKKRENEAHYKQIESMQPLGRFGKAEEVGAFVGSVLEGHNMLMSGAIFELSGAV
ncbi:SDR family oxidoreductase [Helicobacter jaachi]|uniref:SDR family oxidoreductase n=1 Tax=Helicobacter jaachi TaxID=1677920 RepID=A0A4U8T5X1_9HELI|nr:SDR family oxidoreductase [Helicobacter jaachi]TLD94874.1 SDR family oxidoreductase [Helicobacter jaachi]